MKPGSRSGSSSSGASSDWYAPSNGSRTNTLYAGNFIVTVPERQDGVGFPLPRLNGVYADTTEALARSPFTFSDTDVPCNFHTWSTQRDKDYYTVFYDDSYENSAIMIRFLKSCWVVFQGTLCTGKPDTPATTTLGTGLLRWGGPRELPFHSTWSSQPSGAYTVTNEQAADGLALPFNVMRAFIAGEVWKPILMSTVVTSILPYNDSSSQGLMACETYIEITRFSND